MSQPINIVFTNPPGPDGCEFIEVENDEGKSLSPEQFGGEWRKRPDGLWALRISKPPTDVRISEQ